MQKRECCWGIHTSARGVVSNLVTHDLHDVVTVGDETERQGGGKDSKLPDGDGSLGAGSLAGVPSAVDDSPRSDSVTDIVGTVSERGSTGSDDLDERVGVLNLVGVLLGVAVDTLHTLSFGSAVYTSLSSVDVVVDTIEGTDDELGGNALESDDHILLLVDFAVLDLVLVEVTHSPGERSSLSPELGVEALLTLLDELLVSKLALLLNDGTLLSASANLRVAVVVLEGDLIIVLYDSVVRNNRSVGIVLSRTLEKKRSLEGVPPAYTGVALDNLGMEVGNEEDEGQGSESNTARHGDGSDIPRGLLVETEVGRSLVDDGQSTNGSGNEEEEGSSPDGPWNWVLADVDTQLDQHEDDGTEASRGKGSHSETSKDGTETLALVPSPLDLRSTCDSNTDTSNRGDEGVGRRDVGRVLGAPHDPERGTSEGAGECQHLDTSIALEGTGRNDTVLNGIGSTGTDSDGTHHLEDGTQDHGLAVRNGAGGNRSSPSVGNIVFEKISIVSYECLGDLVRTSTVVVSIEHGKEGANGKDIVVLRETRHLGGSSLDTGCV